MHIKLKTKKGEQLKMRIIFLHVVKFSVKNLKLLRKIKYFFHFFKFNTNFNLNSNYFLNSNFNLYKFMYILKKLYIQKMYRKY